MPSLRFPHSSLTSLMALGGGALLASMIGLNSLVAFHTSPWLASWLAHGIGAIAVVGLIQLGRWLSGVRPEKTKGAPAWAYLGGLPGALTVVLAAICVNSPLGLAGTMVLGLAGQVVFGMAADHFGLFGLARRHLTLNDVAVTLAVLSGSGLIIFNGY